MRKIVFLGAMLAIASLTSACGPVASNAENKSANAANGTAAAPAPNPAAIDSDIKKAVSDMAAALQRNDAAYFEKLYTDNYMFVSPDGRIASGKERVASMKSGETKYDSISYDEVTVRSNPEGNGAVSISRATVKGINLGRPVDGQYRVTHVWSKTKDGWKLASGQTTPIAAGTTAPSNSSSGSDSTNKSNSSEEPTNKASSNK